MHDADDPSGPSLIEQRSRVVFRFPRVNDDGEMHLGSKSYLGGKRRALRWARRIVVVVVEPALPDRDRSAKKLTEPGDVALLVESGRIVGMDARRRENKRRVLGGEGSRNRRYFKRLADANDSHRARVAGAGDYRVAVAVERRVREVGVAVDEVWRAPVWRGHLRSIQRSTGAAT